MNSTVMLLYKLDKKIRDEITIMIMWLMSESLNRDYSNFFSFIKCIVRISLLKKRLNFVRMYKIQKIV